MGAKRDERVQRGIDHIVDVVNGGMHQHIDKERIFAEVDLDTLDQGDSTQCVVSQLFGSKFGYRGYVVGISLLGLKEGIAAEYGFDCDGSDNYDIFDGKDHKYPDKLTKAWVKAIKEIRGDT
jgi:hypothetical protein